MSLERSAVPESYEEIFVARQPVFTAKQSVWGYELFFRHSGKAKQANILDPDAATAHVIADGYAIAQEQIESDKFVLINFPKNLLLDGTAKGLPLTQCIPEILETVEPTEDVLAACRDLKASGYRLALDDYVGEEGYEDFLELADIVKVDVMGMSLTTLALLANKLRKYGVTLLAEKVEDRRTFEACRDLGYELFQGYYFSRPEVMSGHKVSSSELVKIKIMALLNRDFDSKELAKILARDVSLSYRLLKYINCPAFGFSQAIRSLEQAIALLGQQPIRCWLMVALLADMNPSPVAQETTFVSVQRARFLSLAAEQYNLGYSPETMFLLGLFSKLDVLMGTPMEKLIGLLPFDEDIKGAFLDNTHPLFAWLENAAAIEKGDAKCTEEFFTSNKLPMVSVALLFNQATSWTGEILGNLFSDEGDG